jgi:hypothetical protein
MVILFTPQVTVLMVLSNGSKGSIGTPEFIYVTIATPEGVIPGTSISKSESIGVNWVVPVIPKRLFTGADEG